MARIDREALKRDLIKVGALEMVIGIIDKQPEIPAGFVPPVRCERCKHYRAGMCYLFGRRMDEMDYCAYGRYQTNTEV